MLISQARNYAKQFFNIQIILKRYCYIIWNNTYNRSSTWIPFYHRPRPSRTRSSCPLIRPQRQSVNRIGYIWGLWKTGWFQCQWGQIVLASETLNNAGQTSAHLSLSWLSKTRCDVTEFQRECKSRDGSVKVRVRNSHY